MSRWLEDGAESGGIRVGKGEGMVGRKVLRAGACGSAGMSRWLEDGAESGGIGIWCLILK